MKRKWVIDYENDEGPPDKCLIFDEVEVATVQRQGTWWEVRFAAVEYDIAPDGARFESHRGAMIFASKHATVLWIGGRYAEDAP
jgi:hypothetical protein